MKLFEQLINLLVVGAIFLTVVKTYLTANKVWSRKHKKDVAESISVSAQLIGIMTSLPFLIKYTIIDSDLMSFANMSIKLALTLFFLAIGIGLWVRVEGHEGLWSKIKRSLKLEKKESMDLINALIRPAGARIILEALQKMASIDRKLDEREMEFIQEFADKVTARFVPACVTTGRRLRRTAAVPAALPGSFPGWKMRVLISSAKKGLRSACFELA